MWKLKHKSVMKQVSDYKHRSKSTKEWVNNKFPFGGGGDNNPKTKSEN